MQRGAALCPFAVFSHSNVIYPLRGRSLCAIQPEAAAYAAYTTGVPQSMWHIRPEFRNPYGHSAGASAAHAVIRPEFRNPCGIYGRDSAIYAAIRPGPPQPMRLLFPHTKFRKYLINKVFPK